ncbi:hypothetical protein Tco_1417179 [Tanacetum coccineum]
MAQQQNANNQSFCWKFGSIVGFHSYRVIGLKVRSVHPYVIEHPDSNSGKREFKSLMKFSEFTLHKVKDTIKEKSIRGCILSGLSHQEEKVEESEIHRERKELKIEERKKEKKKSEQKEKKERKKEERKERKKKRSGEERKKEEKRME